MEVNSNKSLPIENNGGETQGIKAQVFELINDRFLFIRKHIEKHSWKELSECLSFTNCLEELECDGDQHQRQNVLAQVQTYEISLSGIKQKQELSTMLKQAFSDYNQEDNLQESFEHILKILSKLYTPDLSFTLDAELFGFFWPKRQISASTIKYIFILFKEALSYDPQSLLLGQEQNVQYIQTEKNCVKLKCLIGLTEFLRLIRVGGSIFKDVIECYNQFYSLFAKIGRQVEIEGSEGESQAHYLRELFLMFVSRTNSQIGSLVSQLKIDFLAKHNSEEKVLLGLFELLQMTAKWLGQVRMENIGLQQERNRVHEFIDDLVRIFEINPMHSLLRRSRVDCLWLSSTKNMAMLVTVYSSKTVVEWFGRILIEQLPSEPKKFIVQPQLFELILYICTTLRKHELVSSLSLSKGSSSFDKVEGKSDHSLLFYVELFQRLIIAKGLLIQQSVQQPSTFESIGTVIKQIEYVLEKASCWWGILHPLTFESLWRKIYERHNSSIFESSQNPTQSNTNFNSYCLSQYKRIFTAENRAKAHCEAPKAEENKRCNELKVVLSSQKFVGILVEKQMKPNSEIGFIGFCRTFMFYWVCSVNRQLKKIIESKKEPSNKSFMEYLAVELLSTMFKLERGLKFIQKALEDRLELNSQKTRGSGLNTLTQQNSEIELCVFQVEQLLREFEQTIHYRKQLPSTAEEP